MYYPHPLTALPSSFLFVFFLWNFYWGQNYGPGVSRGMEMSKSIIHGPLSLRFTTYQERKALETNPSHCVYITVERRLWALQHWGKAMARIVRANQHVARSLEAERKSYMCTGRPRGKCKHSQGAPPQNWSLAFLKTVMQNILENQVRRCFVVSKTLWASWRHPVWPHKRRLSSPLSQKLEIVIVFFETSLNGIRFLSLYLSYHMTLCHGLEHASPSTSQASWQYRSIMATLKHAYGLVGLAKQHRIQHLFWRVAIFPILHVNGEDRGPEMSHGLSHDTNPTGRGRIQAFGLQDDVVPSNTQFLFSSEKVKNSDGSKRYRGKPSILLWLTKLPATLPAFITHLQSTYTAVVRFL